MACVAGKHAKNHGRSQLCVYSDPDSAPESIPTDGFRPGFRV